MVMDEQGVYFFFVKQKTAYEMRISDWSSDVCSSELIGTRGRPRGPGKRRRRVANGKGRTMSETGSAIRAGVTALQDIERTEAELDAIWQIGSATCTERVCKYV